MQVESANAKKRVAFSTLHSSFCTLEWWAAEVTLLSSSSPTCFFDGRFTVGCGEHRPEKNPNYKSQTPNYPLTMVAAAGFAPTRPGSEPGMLLLHHAAKIGEPQGVAQFEMPECRMRNFTCRSAFSIPHSAFKSGTEFRCCPEHDCFWGPVCTSWCPPSAEVKNAEC